MSQINNIITTTFRASGGNMVTSLNSYAAGFGRIGTAINDNVGMSARLNNQWRAIGTTIRYAIAGSALYGLGNMVRQLSQVNQQLGEMQALTSIGPGTRFSDSDLNDLFTGLQQTAVDTITPLADVNDAAINFLSTVQGVKKSELPRMLTEIGRAAKIAQTPVQDLTQAATVAQVQFQRPVNPTTIGQYTRMWEQMIGEAPGAAKAGPEIALAMPNLASMFQAFGGGGISPQRQQAQLMALTLGVLRTGAPPSTAMRGLSFLLQSLAQPTGASKTNLAKIGITPEFIKRRGINAALMRFLHQIVPTTTMAGAKELGGIPEESNALPGIDPVRAARMREYVPRIHGIRAAIILATQLQHHGQTESLAQDLQTMLALQNANSAQSKKLADAWKDVERHSQLAQATVAVQTMGVQVAKMFDPVFNFVARGPIDLSGAMRHHHGAATIAGRTFVGALAGIGLGRFLGLGNLPGIRNIPFLGKLMRGGMSAVPQTMATMAALTADPRILGASPQNPMYVSVINDLFGGGTAPPSSGPGSRLATLEKDAEGVAKVGIGARLLGFGKGATSRVGNLFKMLRADPEGMMLAGRLLTPAMLGWEIHKHGWKQVLDPFASAGGDISRENTVRIGGRLVPAGSSQAWQASLARAHQLFGGHVTNVAGGQFPTLKGQADVNLVITREHADGSRTRQRVHVPVDLWSRTGHAPTHRGGKPVRTR